MVTGVTSAAAVSHYTTGNADYFVCSIFTEFSEYEYDSNTNKKAGLGYIELYNCDRSFTLQATMVMIPLDPHLDPLYLDRVQKTYACSDDLIDSLISRLTYKFFPWNDDMNKDLQGIMDTGVYCNTPDTNLEFFKDKMNGQNEQNNEFDGPP